MRGKPFFVLAAILLHIYFTSASFAAEPSFQGLGYFSASSPYSMVRGVSADGSTVVGNSRTNANFLGEAFRWTAQEGMQPLGFLPGRDYLSNALDVSADGSKITGYSGSTLNDCEPFLWTQSEGMQSLGFVFDASNSRAQAISNDGSTVVGNTYVPFIGLDVAFQWTSSNGMGLLQGFASGYNYYAYGISGDGSTVVGETNGQAYRRTSPGNVQLLGDLPGGDFYSEAQDASEDGTTVVGYGCVNLIPEDSNTWRVEMEAFSWTPSGGMISLGDLPGGIRYSWASAVSADGSVVVGFGTTDNSEKAFIWDELHGMLDLQELLEDDYSLDLSGWILNSATGISSDGKVIVGYGRNPSGNMEGWIATIPEPATVLLLGLGGFILRRKGK